MDGCHRGRMMEEWMSQREDDGRMDVAEGG